MSSSPPFTLSRATVADLPEAIALQYACFEPIIHHMIMGCDSEADLPQLVEHTAATMARDPYDVWITVRDIASGRMIAASNWKVHINPSPLGPGEEDPYDDKPAPWLSAERAAESKKVLDAMNTKRHKANPGGYVHLHICYTDKAYRRRGAGKMMLQWGCDLADQLFLPGWVEASEEGNALYKTFGFYDYEKIGGPIEGINMKRLPRAKGIEGGKDAPVE